MNAAQRSVACAILVSIAAACGPAAEDVVEGTGTIEIVEVDIAPSLPARVEWIGVDEGDFVKAGDTIAVLTIPTLAAELEQARADEARTVAAFQELEAGAQRREIERAEAEVAAVEAELRRAVEDSVRLSALAARRLIADAEMTAVRAAVEAGIARRDAAAASLRLLTEGTRNERLTAATAEVRRARAGVAAAEATASDLVLLATAPGVVLSRNAEPGEMVPAGRSVATIGDTARPWVRVYLGPQHTPLLQPGDSVRAVLDAVPERPFKGRIASIATRAEYTPRVALTETERADLLFAVRIDLFDDGGMLKPGLPVTVRFYLRSPTPVETSSPSPDDR
jgi:HlyD family secretion protein